MFKLTDTTAVIRPADKSNSDYAAYLKWLMATHLTL